MTEVDCLHGLPRQSASVMPAVGSVYIVHKAVAGVTEADCLHGTPVSGTVAAVPDRAFVVRACAPLITSVAHTHNKRLEQGHLHRNCKFLRNGNLR